MRSDDQAAVQRAFADAGIDTKNFAIQRASPSGTVFRFDVESAEAVAIWSKIRPLVSSIGHYPIVCHDQHGTLAELPELNGGEPKALIEAAASIDASLWFRKQQEAYGDDDVEQGEWEDVEPQSGWSVPFDVLTGKPVDGVWIALVPTTRPWEAMAYLDYGGWNACPDTEVHVAVHKSWNDRYGAEVVCVSGDVVEMRVARPPSDRTGATELAREQFLYSGGDLVYQGYGTMNALASALINADYWYFWWD